MAAPYERWVMAEGFLGEVFVTLTGGAFLTGLALAIGAGPVSLALLAALPFLAQVGQLAAPILEQRLRSRRRFVVPAMAAARLLWLVPAALAVLGLRDESALGLAMLAMFSMGLLAMVATNGWTAWMADLVAPADRARLFGRRAWAVSFATLVAAPLGALLLDFLSRRGDARLAYGVLGLVATLAGLGAARMLRRVPDAAPPVAEDESLLATARRLSRAPRFRRVVGFFVAWNVAIGLPAPFWTLYMLEQLHMSFFLVTLHMVVVLTVRLACNAAWSRVIERVGSRRVLIACGCAIAGIPLFWALPTPDRIWPVFCEATVSGIVWTGFNQAAFIQPMASLAPADRSRGLALLNVGTGAALFGSALLGGAILKQLGATHQSSFLVLFVASAVLRLSTALLAMRLSEPHLSFRGFFVAFIGHGVLRRPSAGRLWIPIEVPTRRDDAQ